MTTDKLGRRGLHLSGFLWKEGRRLKRKEKRFFMLKAGVLSCRKDVNAQPSWEVSLSGCEVGRDGEKRIEIQFPFRVLVLHAEDAVTRDRWADALLRGTSSDITKFYTIGRTIGQGCFGEVRIGISNQTRDTVAVKIIKKKLCTPEDLQYLQREVEIVRDLNHENVVKTFDIFETVDILYICMEYMAGGMLYDNISEAGYFTEQIASKIFAEILLGVDYLHEHGIAHRDIKPENILCSSAEWPYRVKLSDFGLSNFSAQPMRTRVGTPYFVAPEVLKGESYGAAVDSWSCGVVLYNLLSGRLPFDSLDKPEQIFRMILKGHFTFPESEWRDISEEAKTLISNLLIVDPNKRFTIQQALASPWLDATTLSDANIGNDRSRLHSSRRSLPRFK